jgi:hypothetical protein
MTSRYDQLNPRARWYLNNFDEIDLADICAAHEASNQTREAALARVRHLADAHPVAIPTNLVDAALDQPAAHDGGPSIVEAAADDARWWGGEKAGE